MATPKITDIVSGKGYKADGVQFSLNPATNRYQEASTFQVPQTTTAMPSEVSTKMDFTSLTQPKMQGSISSAYNASTDMSPVAQATAGTAEQIVRDQQAQASKSQAAQTDQAISDYVKKYLGLSGDTGVAEQKAQDTAKLTQEADISGTTSKLKDLSTKMDALSIQTEAEKQAILASPIGGITSADLSGREQEITRKNNISRLKLAADSLVLQGKLDSAKEAIKNAIDLKYAPQEARYKSILEFNTLNEKTLGKEAEKQKDLANAKIKDLEEKKKNEEEIGQMIAEAVPNAPDSVIANAKKLAESGASKLEVAQSLGVYGGDVLKRMTYESQLLTDKAQRANIYSQIAERNAKAIKENQLANFVTPPVVNAQTGAVDPKSMVASVIKSTGGKLKGGQAALDVLSSVQSLADRNAKGEFAGVGFGSGLVPERFKDQTEISNRQDIEAIGLKVQQWASGASLTEEQTKMVNKFTPQGGDSDNAVKTKINGLVNFMMGQISSDLVGQGINFAPAPIDMFSGIKSVDNTTLLNSIPSGETDTTKLIDNKSFFDR